jgi:predicted DNA-binding transcriptional regulator AlpA
MGINDDLKDWMQIGFERLMARLDQIERYLEKMAIKEKLLEGERLLDNQDVCQLLNVSKRTLQRYRSSGELPYQMIYHKTFYKESDVEAFIKANFQKRETLDNDASRDVGNDAQNTDVR